MKLNTSLLLPVVLGIGLTAIPVAADTIVVPGGFDVTEANSSDNAPLGVSGQHFQQVFGLPLLTGLSPGDWITGIGFRVAGNESALPAQTVSTYNISLGQSANAPGSMSATFADNRGGDFTLVRSGSLTIATGDFPGGASPNSFGWIPFSTPYQYQGGNLLVEVEYQGFTTGRNADAAYPYNSTLAQAAFGTGFGSTTANQGLYNEAIVMGFTTVPSVPEPSAALLYASGLILFGVGRRVLLRHV